MRTGSQGTGRIQIGRDGLEGFLDIPGEREHRPGHWKKAGSPVLEVLVRLEQRVHDQVWEGSTPECQTVTQALHLTEFYPREGWTSSQGK